MIKFYGKQIGGGIVGPKTIQQIVVAGERVFPVTAGAKPSSLTPSGTYNGSEISNGYTTPSNVTMTGNNKGTNAGTYTATYTPDFGYCWSDGTKDSVTVTLTIGRASVGAKPSSLTPSGTYNGSEISNGYSTPSHVTMSGNNKGTNAGTYTATYTPDANYCWSDMTTESVTVTLTINKAAGSASGVRNLNPTYNGSNQYLCSEATSATGTVYYARDGYSYSTDRSTAVKASAGTVTVYYYAAESENYTQSPTYSVSCSVARASVGAKPSGATYNYTGGTFSPYNIPSGVNSSGTTSAVSGGNYTAYYAPDGNHCWNDGTINTVTVNWTIQYVWNVYNAVAHYSYTSESFFVGGRPGIQLLSGKTYAAISHQSGGPDSYFDSNTGLFTIDVAQRAAKVKGENVFATTTYDDSYSAVSSNECIRIEESELYVLSTGFAYSHDDDDPVRGTKYTSYTDYYYKGSTHYGTETSTNINAYPTNEGGAKQGDYWYVKTW